MAINQEHKIDFFQKLYKFIKLITFMFWDSFSNVLSNFLDLFLGLLSSFWVYSALYSYTGSWHSFTYLSVLAFLVKLPRYTLFLFYISISRRWTVFMTSNNLHFWFLHPSPITSLHLTCACVCLIILGTFFLCKISSYSLNHL